jgi:hypothetical protein
MQQKPCNNHNPTSSILDFKIKTKTDHSLILKIIKESKTGVSNKIKEPHHTLVLTTIKPPKNCWYQRIVMFGL